MLGLLQSKAVCYLWKHDLAPQSLNLSYSPVLCIVLPLVTLKQSLQLHGQCRAAAGYERTECCANTQTNDRQVSM